MNLIKLIFIFSLSFYYLMNFINENVSYDFGIKVLIIILIIYSALMIYNNIMFILDGKYVINNYKNIKRYNKSYFDAYHKQIISNKDVEKLCKLHKNKIEVSLLNNNNMNNEKNNHFESVKNIINKNENYDDSQKSIIIKSILNISSSDNNINISINKSNIPLSFYFPYEYIKEEFIKINKNVNVNFIIS